MQKNNREQAVNFSSAGDISLSLVFRQTFGRAGLLRPASTRVYPPICSARPRSGRAERENEGCSRKRRA